MNDFPYEDELPDCVCLPGDGFCPACGCSDAPPYDPGDRVDPEDRIMDLENQLSSLEASWHNGAQREKELRDEVSGLEAEVRMLYGQLDEARADAKKSADTFCRWWSEDTLKSYDAGYAAGYAVATIAVLTTPEG